MKVISQRLIRVLPTRGPEIGRDTAGCSISQPSPPLLRVSLTLLPLRRRHPPFGSPCGAPTTRDPGQDLQSLPYCLGCAHHGGSRCWALWRARGEDAFTNTIPSTCKRTHLRI